MAAVGNGGPVGMPPFVCTLCDGAKADFEVYTDVVSHIKDVHKVSEAAVNSVIKAPAPEGLRSYRCILCSETFSGNFIGVIIIIAVHSLITCFIMQVSLTN